MMDVKIPKKNIPISSTNSPIGISFKPEHKEFLVNLTSAITNNPWEKLKPVEKSNLGQKCLNFFTRYIFEFITKNISPSAAVQLKSRQLNHNTLEINNLDPVFNNFNIAFKAFIKSLHNNSPYRLSDIFKSSLANIDNSQIGFEIFLESNVILQSIESDTLLTESQNYQTSSSPNLINPSNNVFDISRDKFELTSPQVRNFDGDSSKTKIQIPEIQAKTIEKKESPSLHTERRNQSLVITTNQNYYQQEKQSSAKSKNIPSDIEEFVDYLISQKRKGYSMIQSIKQLLVLKPQLEGFANFMIGKVITAVMAQRPDLRDDFHSQDFKLQFDKVFNSILNEYSKIINKAQF